MAEAEHSKSRIQTKLQLKDFKLNTLLELTKAINNNVSSDKLFTLFEFILRNQLNIGKLMLFSFNGKQWNCVLKYGTKGREKQLNVKEDLSHIREITLIESSSKDYLNVFDIVIPVYHKEHPLAYLLVGDIDEQEINVSPIIKHMPFIQTLTNFLAVAIENKRLANEQIQQERVKKELELASEMQNMLFPETLPDDVHLQIAAYYQPHQQVGGDYYDFIRVNDDEVIFCLADVSGKGVSAALLMANFQANLRALVNYERELPVLIEQLNEKVWLNAKGEKFITIFLAKYNEKTRELSYINAAHNPPLLKKEDEIVFLSTGCTGLGMFEQIPQIEEGKVSVPTNAILVCYTDGVVELENERKQDYGTDRLKELIFLSSNLPMEKMNREIVKDLEEFRGEMPYIDDVALFSCRFF